MSAHTTFIVIIFELLVLASSLWLIVSYFIHKERFKRRKLLRVCSMITIGVSLTGITILANLAAHKWNSNTQWGSFSTIELWSWVAISCGNLIVIVALHKGFQQILQSRKPLVAPSRTDTKNTDVTLPDQSHNTTETTDKALVSTLFNDGPSLFVITDTKLVIQEIGHYFAKLIGHSADELRGIPLLDLIDNEDRGNLNNLVTNGDKHRKTPFEPEVRFTSGAREPLWIRMSAKVVKKSQGTHRVIIYCQDIRETKSLAEIIAFHSSYDELTMLHNRMGLEKYLAKAIEDTTNTSRPTALFYIDIDQMKVVNDTCGYTAGDRLIQHLVSVIAQSSSQCEMFARVGGDEFALIKLNCSEDEAKAIAESIRSAAEDFTFVWHENNYKQSISVGIALSSHNTNTVIELIGAADAACYTAKQNGKNRVVVHSDGIDESQNNRRDMMWASRLQKAVQESAFELYFQPIERLNDASGHHVHYEFLIRYVDESGEHISPDQFIPAAERFGFSEQIDLWVITTALDYLDKHPEHTRILNCCSINLTSQSIANPRTRSAILQVVQSYDFPAEKICFEITESSAIQNLHEAIEFINELKTLGCSLALDDFGTGFSSFGYLKNLAVNYIKIDGSFVRDIIYDKFDRAMVSAINNIGKEMEIDIIAEYAENLSILRELEGLDVGFAQGFGISRPRPIQELEHYYAKEENR